MFSASLPPVAVAQVMAGFEVLENDGSRVMRLRHNCRLADELLNGQGIVHNPVESAIITVIVPETRDIRKIGKAIHNQGIFLNTVEFPAVPKNAERLRISMMCEHSEEDIAQMASSIKAALA
jgi:glycine C-acetyltransferase